MTQSYGPYGRTQPIPRHLDGVTREWFEGLLANAYPGIGVESLERVAVISTHTTKVRIAVAYNGVGRKAGLPQHLCLKANWSEGFDSGDICELEARFYHNFGQVAGLPAPRSYYADWDGDGSGRGIVVLEDLVDSGGTFGHSTDLIGIDGVARALEAMAGLHGCLWNDERLMAQSWLPRSMATMIDTDQIAFMRPYIDANLARPEIQELLPKAIVADNTLLDRAYGNFNQWVAAQPGPFCLVHGDSHIGNTYLYPDGRRIWLDWQLCRVGHGYRDMTYLMLGALTVEERRKAEKDLIAHYREALIATGAQGVPGVDTLYEHFRRWPIYGIQAWLQVDDKWGLGAFPVIDRISRAIEDLGTLDLLKGA
ncbi:MAG: phosphotransferase [Porticoccaceae bacterium]|jgi:hypothetical protein|nr:phosphotransferase [Porticoccaceae bacterium]MEA3301329.1 phosphotransferase [Pseudomonadota bacterium]HLS97983.1 phosphotransferase [Porticoccaceae bacterium]